MAAEEPTTAQIAALLLRLESQDPEERLSVATELRVLLSTTPPPIDLFIEAGAIPAIVNHLNDDSSAVQFQAAWAVTNIASGQDDHVQILATAGALPLLHRKLTDTATAQNVQEQVVSCIGNIAGSSTTWRDRVLRLGFMEPLLQLFRHPMTPELKHNAAWAMSNLCRGIPQPPWEAVVPCVGTLQQVINDADENVVVDGLWTISYLCSGPNDRVQCIVDAGVYPRVLALMSTGSMAFIPPALRTFGNLVTGDEAQTDYAISLGILNHLAPFLQNDDEMAALNRAKESCWLISNVAAGPSRQIQAVLDAGLVPRLVELVRYSSSDRVRAEAIWALANCSTNATIEQARYLKAEGVLHCICEQLTARAEPQVRVVLQDALENFLRWDATEPWTPELHARLTTRDRPRVVTLFALTSKAACQLSRLSLELVFEILAQADLAIDEFSSVVKANIDGALAVADALAIDSGDENIAPQMRRILQRLEPGD